MRTAALILLIGGGTTILLANLHPARVVRAAARQDTTVVEVVARLPSQMFVRALARAGRLGCGRLRRRRRVMRRVRRRVRHPVRPVTRPARLPVRRSARLPVRRSRDPAVILLAILHQSRIGVDLGGKAYGSQSQKDEKCSSVHGVR